jgi:hypothetical protein
MRDDVGVLVTSVGDAIPPAYMLSPLLRRGAGRATTSSHEELAMSDKSKDDRSDRDDAALQEELHREAAEIADVMGDAPSNPDLRRASRWETLRGSADAGAAES